MKRCALILAGGGGTRLRPLSSEENPKQFLRLFGGRSLIEMTFARVADVVDGVYVSTTEAYAAKTHELLPALPAAQSKLFDRFVPLIRALEGKAPASGLSLVAIGRKSDEALRSDSGGRRRDATAPAQL